MFCWDSLWNSFNIRNFALFCLVTETLFFDQMKQFELTCESGFGMPSGHCMVSVAFWSCLFFTWPKKESRREGEEVQKCSGEGARWLLFGALCIWGGLVALSRVYIAGEARLVVIFTLRCYRGAAVLFRSLS